MSQRDESDESSERLAEQDRERRTPRDYSGVWRRLAAAAQAKKIEYPVRLWWRGTEEHCEIRALDVDGKQPKARLSRALQRKFAQVDWTAVLSHIRQDKNLAEVERSKDQIAASPSGEHTLYRLGSGAFGPVLFPRRKAQAYNPGEQFCLDPEVVKAVFPEIELHGERRPSILDIYEQLDEEFESGPAGPPPTGTSRHAGPRCQILYGPPGTGKTYSTVRRAVEICDGRVEAEWASAKRRFDELRELGRIQFVTFHQSYSYEEFVEGIRPVLDYAEPLDDQGRRADLRYTVEPGVFRNLCDLATSVDESPRAAGAPRLDVAQAVARAEIYKMSLTDPPTGEDRIYQRCIEQGWLLLGYGAGLDFTGCDDQASVIAMLKTKIPDADGNDMNVSTVHMFKNRMQVDDLVIVPDGNHRFRAIGRVSGEYRFLPDEAYQQMRPVEWLATFTPSRPLDQISDRQFNQRTINRPDRNHLRLGVIEHLLREAGDAATGASAKELGPGTSQPNHVLIIDEINRGNISKIFGELITLLEEDKRIGAESELKVTLPYSRESFGVPSNVYLLGTMNTADRSIALLDAALRRRFEFEELMPSIEALRSPSFCGQGGIIEGVDVGLLLAAINERIELLFDRDHQIGHAYFRGVMTLADLRRVFQRKVVPLLQEYFYGDWEKVCAVLGCPLDGQTGKSRNRAPLIQAKAIAAVLDGDGALADAEGRLRFGLNQAFLDAGEADLPAFFAGICGRS